MARGIARPIDERIQLLETQKIECQGKIDSFKKKLSTIDAELKKLKDEKHMHDAGALLDIINASGKSLDEVLSLISK